MVDHRDSPAYRSARAENLRRSKVMENQPHHVPTGTPRLVDLLAANLRAHRRALGLSQEEMAGRIGVHRTWWSALERGDRNVTLGTVEKLAGLLGVEALSLLGAGAVGT